MLVCLGEQAAARAAAAAAAAAAASPVPPTWNAERENDRQNPLAGNHPQAKRQEVSLGGLSGSAPAPGITTAWEEEKTVVH
jgi:hypothetical protein